MKLISNETILNKIKDLITETTGIVAAVTNSQLYTVDTNSSKKVELIENLIVNEKGWILGCDNKRIKVTTCVFYDEKNYSTSISPSKIYSSDELIEINNSIKG